MGILIMVAFRGVGCFANHHEEDHFSPNSVSTLRGSCGKRKGLGARLRCPLWPRAFCVVFTADSCSCLMSKCVLTAQAPTK